jgi:hypothetical protein
VEIRAETTFGGDPLADDEPWAAPAGKALSPLLGNMRFKGGEGGEGGEGRRGPPTTDAGHSSAQTRSLFT